MQENGNFNFYGEWLDLKKITIGVAILRCPKWNVYVLFKWFMFGVWGVINIWLFCPEHYLLTSSNFYWIHPELKVLMGIHTIVSCLHNWTIRIIAWARANYIIWNCAPLLGVERPKGISVAEAKGLLGTLFPNCCIPIIRKPDMVLVWAFLYSPSICSC